MLRRLQLTTAWGFLRADLGTSIRRQLHRTIRTMLFRLPGPDRSLRGSISKKPGISPLIALAAVFAAASVLFCAQAPEPVFEEWTPARTGIVWRHDNGKSQRRYQPESIGPGVAVLDYNNDGRMDLFFPNSGPADFFQPSKPL